MNLGERRVEERKVCLRRREQAKLWWYTGS
jgi:hypothetical protein